MSTEVAMTRSNAPTDGPSGPRLSDMVYARVLEMIIGGQLLPGEPVSELQLSRLLKVSRTPVHEAINRLVKDDLVVQERNRRPVVAAFSPQDVFDVFEMRRILEGESARKAALRVDDSTVRQLEDLTQEFEGDVQNMEPDSREWVERWADCDELFHRIIANACGSKRLASDVLRYRLFHRAFNLKHCSTVVLERAHQEHLRILDAIRDGDADRAMDEMQRHIVHFQQHFAGEPLGPTEDASSAS